MTASGKRRKTLRMTSSPLRVAVLGEPDVIVHGLRDVLGSDAVVRPAHEFPIADVCLWNPDGPIARRLGVERTVALARDCAPRVMVITRHPHRAPSSGADGVVDMGAPAAEIRVALLARWPVPGLCLPDDLREVATLLMAGRTNGEIGTVLHLSESSVVRRLRRLYETLGVTNRVGAVRCLARAQDGVLADAS